MPCLALLAFISMLLISLEVRYEFPKELVLGNPTTKRPVWNLCMFQVLLMGHLVLYSMLLHSTVCTCAGPVRTSRRTHTLSQARNNELPQEKTKKEE